MVRAGQFFVQRCPGWWGLAEPSLTAGYTHTAPTANTKSITSDRQAQRIAFILDCKLHRDRIYSCLYSTQHTRLGSQQGRGRPGTITMLLGIRGWEGTQESCPSLLPVRPPSSHWAGNSGRAPHKYFGAYLPFISPGCKYLDAFGGSGPKSKSPTGRLLVPYILQRQCWRDCYTMEENQDARQKEKAKEIKVRIKFFNTKKSLFVVVVVVF